MMTKEMSKNPGESSFLYTKSAFYSIQHSLLFIGIFAKVILSKFHNQNCDGKSIWYFQFYSNFKSLKSYA